MLVLTAPPDARTMKRTEHTAPGNNAPAMTGVFYVMRTVVMNEDERDAAQRAADSYEWNIRKLENDIRKIAAKYGFSYEVAIQIMRQRNANQK